MRAMKTIPTMAVVSYLAKLLFAQNFNPSLDLQRNVTRLNESQQERQFSRLADLAQKEIEYRYLSDNLTEYYDYHYPDTYAVGRKKIFDILVIDTNIYLLYNGEAIHVVKRESTEGRGASRIETKSKMMESAIRNSSVYQFSRKESWAGWLSEYHPLNYKEKETKRTPYRNEFYRFTTLNPEVFHAEYHAYDMISLDSVEDSVAFPCRENKIPGGAAYLFKQMYPWWPLKANQNTQENIDYVEKLKKVDEEDRQHLPEPVEDLTIFCEVPYNESAHIELRYVSYKMQYRRKQMIPHQGHSNASLQQQLVLDDSQVRTVTFPGRAALFCVYNSTCPAGYMKEPYELQTPDNLNDAQKKKKHGDLPPIHRVKRPSVGDPVVLFEGTIS